jgi:hypothetical protein
LLEAWLRLELGLLLVASHGLLVTALVSRDLNDDVGHFVV